MEAERGRDLCRVEDFYYECIYDLVRVADANPAAIAALHHFKAKLVRLHTVRFRMSMLDTAAADNLPEESPSYINLYVGTNDASPEMSEMYDTTTVLFRHVQLALLSPL
jgi:hypothetical protein